MALQNVITQKHLIRHALRAWTQRDRSLRKKRSPSPEGKAKNKALSSKPSPLGKGTAAERRWWMRFYPVYLAGLYLTRI